MGYDDLPTNSKTKHDEIAATLGLDPATMTEYDVLLAIIRRLT